MKTLPEKFTKNGYEHEQIRREGNIAIFRRHRAGSASVHFEVVKIGSHNGYELAGQKIAPAETYPSSEKWGTDGFTFETLEKARGAFVRMQERHRSAEAKTEEVRG